MQPLSLPYLGVVWAGLLNVPYLTVDDLISHYLSSGTAGHFFMLFLGTTFQTKLINSSWHFQVAETFRQMFACIHKYG